MASGDCSESGPIDAAQIALLAVEHAADVMFTVAPQGEILQCNRAATERLGYSREQMLAMRICDLDPHYDANRWPGHWQELRERRYMRFETVHQHCNGRLIPTEVTVWHFTREGREFACSTARDLTLIKEQEHRRQELERQLHMVQRIESIGLLAGGIAHDFNNALLVIMACTDLVELEIGAPSLSLAPLFADIRRASDRAAELTAQLLSFGRRQVLQRTVTNLNDLLDRHVALMRRLIPASIVITLIPGPALGSVNIDGVQFEQVVTNLCVNAKDAMPQGGKLTLETENVTIDGFSGELHPWARPGRYVLLTVTDTGHGMPAQVRDRIFEPFYTTKEPGRGTGLGLAVAYGIVQQHGGFVHVSSEVGVGTTFEFYLPVVECNAKQMQAKLSYKRVTGNGKILVAEDESAVRRLVATLLERAGYSVECVSNGLEALTRFREDPTHFDLAIVDAIMPELSGVQAQKAMVALRPDFPVIVSSGYSGELVESASDAPVHFVRKPYDGEFLLAKVAHLLGR